MSTRPTIVIREAPASFVSKLRADHPDWNVIHRPDHPIEGGLLMGGFVFGGYFFGIVGDLISLACIIGLIVRWKLVRR